MSFYFAIVPVIQKRQQRKHNGRQTEHVYGPEPRVLWTPFNMTDTPECTAAVYNRTSDNSNAIAIGYSYTRAGLGSFVDVILGPIWHFAFCNAYEKKNRNMKEIIVIMQYE